MKCPQCHAENADDAQFCSLCYARFQVSVRSADVDESARRMHEKHHGSMLCCPNCRELSPLKSQFCLNCGFVFEDLESLMVSEEEVERIEREAQEQKERELRERVLEAVTVTLETDGAELMRGLKDELDKGRRPRLHASGRNAITYTMKIVALLGEEVRSAGGELRSRVYLLSEGPITYLEDVELEIILEYP